MNPTFVFFGTLFGLFVVQGLLWAMFLQIGLRWAKAGRVSIWQAVVAYLIAFALQMVVLFFTLRIPTPTEEAFLAIAAIEVLTGVLVPVFVIREYFKVRFWRSVQAWLPTLIPQIAIILFLFLVYRPFIFEAFAVTANSMAPTLLGEHLQGQCAICNAPAFASPIPPHAPDDLPIDMICQDHLHVTRVRDFKHELRIGDRIAVAKFSEPKRWDIVAFRLPSQPDMIYVKRLVGLPGEQIEIKDGGVWADGKRLEPPEEIRDIEYLSEIPHWHAPLWGTANRPATLGPDEYFVLGDYSAASMDSRFWNEGAPGHHPYAVPKSHIHGVVTHIYWPVNRWRAL